MRDKPGDEARLHHIIDAITEVEQYLYNVTYDQFLTNSEKRFATIKQIEIIGEASNALTGKLKASAPSIPWAKIKGFRNVSIHEYFGVRLGVVWQIAQNDLPPLKEEITKLIDQL